MSKELLMDGERVNTMEGDEDDYGEEEEKAGEAVPISMDEFKDGSDDEGDALLSGGTPAANSKSIENLFQVKESSDKGLGGLDGTASEVYMSELLAGYDMDDFDETEDANEEDLIELGDEFANIKIVDYI